MTFREMLGTRNLMGLIESVRSGIPAGVPESFFTVKERVNGDTFSWFLDQAERKSAQLTRRGSPARVVAQKGLDIKSAQIGATFESQAFDLYKLENLLTPNQQVDDMGRQEITRQTKKFRARFDNLRKYMVHTALAKGILWFDGDGNALPSASGAVITIDFSVPANNKNQLNGIIAVDWSTATAPIIGDLRAIKKQAMRLSGYPLQFALYGAAIPEYIADNTQAQAYITGNPSLAAQRVTGAGEIPSNFGGLEWIPFDQTYMVDQNDAIQELVADDAVIFCPSPALDWWMPVEGSAFVPRRLKTGPGDAASMLADWQKVFGRYSYATEEHNPPSLVQFAGDVFTPFIVVPEAIFIADVVV